MRRRRAQEARSAADRDLHRHVGRAEAAVRAAIDVCGRAARALPREDARSYRVGSTRLQEAEAMLSTIGHLEDSPTAPDMQQEARALLAWLEGRERAAGVSRPFRRGQAYQERLQQVLRFLGGVKPAAPPFTDQKAVPVSPGPMSALVQAQAFGVTDDGA